jgi:hypothetical protein
MFAVNLRIAFAGELFGAEKYFQSRRNCNFYVTQGGLTTRCQVEDALQLAS